MLIFKIAQNKHIDTNIDDYLDSQGVVVYKIDSSSMSFLTSMRIATEQKKHKPDAVVVYRKKDAMAALSARKLSEDNNKALPYPIIFYADESSETPTGIAREIENNIDAWVFDSEKTATKWRQIKGLEHCKYTIIPHPGDDTAIQENKDPGHKTTLTFVGQIGDGKRLAAVLDHIYYQHPDADIDIRILGTGKARYVMPIVRKTRANKMNITWLGDVYDTEYEYSLADAWIKSRTTPTETEIRLMANGKPGIDETNFDKLLDKTLYKELADNAKEEYKTNYTKEQYASRIKELITQLYQ